DPGTARDARAEAAGATDGRKGVLPGEPAGPKTPAPGREGCQAAAASAIRGRAGNRKAGVPLPAWFGGSGGAPERPCEGGRVRHPIAAADPAATRGGKPVRKGPAKEGISPRAARGEERACGARSARA